MNRFLPPVGAPYGMPLNSLMPVFEIPWTFPLVVSTSQKICRSELAPKPAAGREGVCVACANALDAAVAPVAIATAANDEPFKNARRLDFAEYSRRFPISTCPSCAIISQAIVRHPEPGRWKTKI